MSAAPLSLSGFRVRAPVFVETFSCWILLPHHPQPIMISSFRRISNRYGCEREWFITGKLNMQLLQAGPSSLFQLFPLMVPPFQYWPEKSNNVIGNEFLKHIASQKVNHFLPQNLNFWRREATRGRWTPGLKKCAVRWHDYWNVIIFYRTSYFGKIISFANLPLIGKMTWKIVLNWPLSWL